MEKNNLCKLSICIPTYNRKERLINQLHSILNQKSNHLVQIIICDNHSNYDICEDLAKEFGSNFVNNIIIYKNKVNIGADANIANLFMLCDTEWMWLLGDDDKTTNTSIETILNDINSFDKNTIGCTYSIYHKKKNKDLIINDVESFIDYYYKGNSNSGELVYISNKIYNTEIIKPYIGQTIKYSYSSLSQLIPILKSLQNNNGSYVFSSKCIVEYQVPEIGSEWNFIPTVLGTSIISHIDFGIKKNYDYRLRSIIFRDWHWVLVERCLKNQQQYKYKEFYRYLYKNMISKGNRWKDFLIYIIANLCFCFRIKTIKPIKKILAPKSFSWLDER